MRTWLTGFTNFAISEQMMPDRSKQQQESPLCSDDRSPHNQEQANLATSEMTTPLQPIDEHCCADTAIIADESSGKASLAEQMTSERSETATGS